MVDLVTRIDDEIARLQDDIISCQNAMRPTNDASEHQEYSQRIVADREQLSELRVLKVKTNMQAIVPARKGNYEQI